MRTFLLKKFSVLSEKEALLLKAGKDFSRAADDLLARKQDESFAWKAFGAFCEDLSSVKSSSELEDVKGIIKNEKTLYTYIHFIKQKEQQAFESEMRAFKHEMKEEVSVIKKQNVRLDDQNIQLLDRNEVLEKQGVRSTRLALTLFALSVAINFVPMAAKKLGYDLDPAAKPVTMARPKDMICYRQKFNVCGNCHTVSPITSSNRKLPKPVLDRKCLSFRPAKTALKAQP